MKLRGLLQQGTWRLNYRVWKKLVRSKTRAILIITITLSIIILVEVSYTTVPTHHSHFSRQDFNIRNKTQLAVRKRLVATCTREFKSRHFMTPKIGGRLANRLFLVGNLIAAAEDSCYTPVLEDDCGLGQYFDLHNVVIMNFNKSTFKGLGESGWGKYDGPIAEKISPDYNWTIWGIRQSYKYFQDKKDLIQSSFVFKEEIRTAVLKYLTDNSFVNKTKVGVHIRLTDFINPEHVQTGYVISSLYYIFGAMAYFKYHFPGTDLTYIIVSDDIEWCKETIQAPNTHFSPFNDPGKDLYLLTQCDHHIVTSGTFGWMGAWLNETGTVVYDKMFPRYNSTLWHGYRKEDYYPDWWIGL